MLLAIITFPLDIASMPTIEQFSTYLLGMTTQRASSISFITLGIRQFAGKGNEIRRLKIFGKLF